MNCDLIPRLRSGQAPARILRAGPLHPEPRSRGEATTPWRGQQQQRAGEQGFDFGGQAPPRPLCGTCNGIHVYTIEGGESPGGRASSSAGWRRLPLLRKGEGCDTTLGAGCSSLPSGERWLPSSSRSEASAGWRRLLLLPGEKAVATPPERRAFASLPRERGGCRQAAGACPERSRGERHRRASGSADGGQAPAWRHGKGPGARKWRLCG